MRFVFKIKVARLSLRELLGLQTQMRGRIERGVTHAGRLQHGVGRAPGKLVLPLSIWAARQDAWRPPVRRARGANTCWIQL
jgi:hypothetical protein